MTNQLKNLYFLMFTIIFINSAHATLIIPMYSTVNEAKTYGYIEANDTIYGLMLTPHLYGLRHGIHGFNVRTLPFCTNHGRAAGGHYDPLRTGEHKGPFEGSGHLGDLPALYANQKGIVTLSVLAPRLKLASIKGRALMIQVYGDNYSDEPKKQGGGGASLACGVIPYFS